MTSTISITGFSSVSALGNKTRNIWEHYLQNQTTFSTITSGTNTYWVSALEASLKAEMVDLRHSDSKYKSLDDAVLFAITASRDAVRQAGWTPQDVFGINIGSSRGATQLFETHFEAFLKTGKAQTLSSPTTTLGNIASWVGHDLQSSGPEISHSITCSTALHAMLNGIAWLKSGMATKFLIGGSEAPLTPFTLAQMQALKIYSTETGPFPNRALDLNKTKNTMILGEGAAVCCLEFGKKDNALAFVEGFGYATEILEHNISISAEATCFQKSMKMALQNTALSEIDAIVMHAPGTIKGDLTEFKAIQKIFGAHLPLLTTNKWKIGHTFGASGTLSLELALLMMQHQTFIGVPNTAYVTHSRSMKKVLINAVGFGGNAVSILLKSNF